MNFFSKFLMANAARPLTALPIKAHANCGGRDHKADAATTLMMEKKAWMHNKGSRNNPGEFADNRVFSCYKGS